MKLNFATFATQAAKPVKVPITLHGISGRYATALFTAATKENVLEKVNSQLSAISALLDKDAKLKTFFETPLIDRALKKEGVASMFKKGTIQGHQVTTNFFNLLAENGRLDQTVKIVQAFNQLMTASRDEVSIVVTSAVPLDSSMSVSIKDSLQKSSLFEKSSKLVISNKVDPQILGGLIIEIGDEKTIDLSVSSKINKYNQLLVQSI